MCRRQEVGSERRFPRLAARATSNAVSRRMTGAQIFDMVLLLGDRRGEQFDFVGELDRGRKWVGTRSVRPMSVFLSGLAQAWMRASDWATSPNVLSID